MAYATVTDLQERLGEPRLVQLTDLESPSAGVVNSTVAQRALDDASAEIDGYLAGRYALPLEPAPGILKVHCLTIALYRLLGSAAGEVEREAYKAALQYLDRVGQGAVPLMPPAAAPVPAGFGSVVFEPGEKVMARGAY